QLRSEWRADQEQATLDAAEQWRRNRRFTDWLADRMHAGDRVSVETGTQWFTGTVDEGGADTVAVRGDFGRGDGHLESGVPVQIEVIERATAGGTRGSQRRRFRDVLITRENDIVSVGTTRTPEGLDGRIEVGRDFVTVKTRAGREVVVPIAGVVW